MKQCFINDFNNNGHPLINDPVRKIVVALKLPTGAVEVIINDSEIQSKFDYYCTAFDDMRLKNNPHVRTIQWFFV